MENEEHMFEIYIFASGFVSAFVFGHNNTKIIREKWQSREIQEMKVLQMEVLMQE